MKVGGWYPSVVQQRPPPRTPARVTSHNAMIPLLAAILLAGAAGAGPVLVSDACGQDTTTAESGNTRCAVERIEKTMKSQKVPAELKVSEACVLALAWSSARNTHSSLL